jgi:hypothetical protein
MPRNRFLKALCCGTLMVAGHAGADDLQRQAARQLEDAQRVWAQANIVTPTAGEKEISPGCVPTPIPTTTVGPIWTFEVQTAAAARLRGTAWRQPCGGTNAQLILTFEPVSGTPFVCGSEVEISIGALRTDDIFLDVNPNDGVGTSFCSNLSARTSFVIHEFDNAFAFDDDAAFTLTYESDISADASVAIPAYDPSQYMLAGDLALSGKLAGSYYEPTRDREGVLIELGTAGAARVVFLTWYTYFQGQQRWIVGNATYTPGATRVTIPLIVTTGGQFGAAYNPAQVQVSNWGTATVSFPSCTRMRFEWSEAGGQSGLYQYERLLGGLDGVACP